MLRFARFKHSPSLSRETTAFTAELTWHRVPIAHAENDGHGGATLIHLDPVGLAGRPVARIIAAAQQIVRKGPLAEFAQPTHPDLRSALEELADTFVALELEKREERRLDRLERKHAKSHAAAGRPYTVAFTTEEGDRRIFGTPRPEKVSILLEREGQSLAGLLDGTVRLYHDGARIAPETINPNDYAHN